jgi:Helix-turn-helix of DDE superfamily endonuclease
MLRYHEIAHDERRVLSLTSLTPKEFAGLVPLFTTSFYEYLDEQTIEGYERVGRRYLPYRNSTLPTMEDKLLFILVYLKQAPTQEVQGSLFGMRQSKANMWIHLLHPVLTRALAQNGALPRRDILIELADESASTNDGGTRGSGSGSPSLSGQASEQRSPFLSTMEQSDR